MCDLCGVRPAICRAEERDGVHRKVLLCEECLKANELYREPAWYLVNVSGKPIVPPMIMRNKKSNPITYQLLPYYSEGLVSDSKTEAYQKAHLRRRYGNQAFVKAVKATLGDGWVVYSTN